MKKLCILTALLCTLCAPAFAFVLNGHGTDTVTYQGLIATSAMIPNTSYSGGTLMTRKAHISRGYSTRLSLVYPNWYIGGLGAETGSGCSLVVKAWVEYPTSTYTPVLFSGSSTGTISNDTNLASDYLSLTIPANTSYYTWTYVTSSCNLIPISGNNNGNPLCTSCGEASNSTPTTPGAITDNDNGTRGYFPEAIVGDTYLPTFCLFADSRGAGYEDLADTTTNVGDMARSIGPSYAYINMGVKGDRLSLLYWSSTNRMALTQYCSIVMNEYGYNDLALNNNTTAISTIEKSFTARFNGRRYARTTKEPSSNSTDSWETLGNQTVNVNVNTYNDYVRSPGDGVPYVEISNVLSTAQDSGLWITNGTAFGYTADGIHASNNGYLYLGNSGAVRGAQLANNPAISVSYPSPNMTVVGTNTFGTGKFSQALSGGGGYVYGLAPGVPPMAVECWANSSTASSTNMIICSTPMLGIFATATNCYAAMETGDNTVTASSTNICDGSWHHLAATVTSAGLFTLYVDGTSSATYSLSLGSANFDNISPSTVKYNGSFSGSPVIWPGSVDEMAIWNYLKYTTNFTPPTQPYVGTENGLAGLWHFDSNLNGILGPAGM
jgi:Concanavalin A-like lectin/glucanases superfamily